MPPKNRNSFQFYSPANVAARQAAGPSLGTWKSILREGLSAGIPPAVQTAGFWIPEREAQQEEAAVYYQKTVLQAWHDVDNAMTAYQTEQARRDQLVLAVAQSQRALELAQSRYQQGVADFLTVLDAERSLLSTQQQLADSTTNVSQNLVALYKALGGGWETDLPREATADAAK